MQSDFYSSLFNLNQKVVVVTGATGQLGTVICQGFLDAGSRVIGLDKILVEENKIKSPLIEYLPLDIVNEKAVIKTFDDVVNRYSKIDILINNAGVSCFEPFEERPEESFDWVMDVNLKGTFFCIKNLVNINKGKPASIVNIASFYGVISPDFRIYTDCLRKNSEVYGATKAGVIQMTKYFACHLALKKMRVNSVSPGGIFNPASPQGEDFIKNYGERCPMQRMAKAKEMLGAILYLASDASTYTNGHNLIVDGGMSCW